LLWSADQPERRFKTDVTMVRLAVDRSTVTYIFSLQ
jgi:hypothetical protein